MAEDPGLFETIFSTRAMRRLKADPVPAELIEKILRAGQAAANGGNIQSWGFIVVQDPAIKRQVQVYYQRAYDEFVRGYYAQNRAKQPPGEAQEKLERQEAAVRHLTEHFHEAPVWIVACVRDGLGKAAKGSGGSISPAVQNMLLAARALGLGATLTTRHLLFAEEVDAIFGLPPGISSYAILPIGYPLGRFGPVGRGPLANVVYKDRWGQAYF